MRVRGGGGILSRLELIIGLVFSGLGVEEAEEEEFFGRGPLFRRSTRSSRSRSKQKDPIIVDRIHGSLGLCSFGHRMAGTVGEGKCSFV